eukprot:scaffold126650_cov33-Tisochrysis_lutea.AAC.3
MCLKRSAHRARAAYLGVNEASARGLVHSYARAGRVASPMRHRWGWKHRGRVGPELGGAPRALCLAVIAP